MGLHGGPERDDLIGIELAVRRLAEQLLYAPAHERHACGAADQDDLVDVGRAQPRVGKCAAAGPERAPHQRFDEPLEVGARHLAAVREAGERQRQRRALLARQADLRRLGSQPELLHRLRIAREIDAVAVELGVMARGDVLEQPQRKHAVEVVAAEMCVAVGREHLEHTVLDAEDRHVECAAAQVVDRDDAL